jgi:hypothetical protein
VVEPAAHGRQRALVRLVNHGQNVFGDVEVGDVREKVVADKETEQHPVINQPLNVKRKAQHGLRATNNG